MQNTTFPGFQREHLFFKKFIRWKCEKLIHLLRLVILSPNILRNETIWIVYWTFYFPRMCLLFAWVDINLTATDNVYWGEGLTFTKPNPRCFLAANHSDCGCFLAEMILDDRVVYNFTLFHFTCELLEIRLVFFKNMIQLNFYWVDFKKEKKKLLP